MTDEELAKRVHEVYCGRFEPIGVTWEAMHEEDRQTVIDIVSVTRMVLAVEDVNIYRGNGNDFDQPS